MTTQQSESTDKGIGLTMAFGTLAALGALAMIVGAYEFGGTSDGVAAAGFGLAMVFAVCAVVAVHLWA